MVDIASISAVVAATGVIVGVILAVMELRNIVRTRRMDMMIRLYAFWGSENIQRALEEVVKSEYKDYNDFSKRFGKITSRDRDPIWGAFSRVGFFFHGLGVLVHRKLADIDLVDELFGYGVTWGWQKMKPVIEGWRKELNMPKSLYQFEYLYNEMQKREQQLSAIQ